MLQSHARAASDYVFPFPETTPRLTIYRMPAIRHAHILALA